MLGGAQALKMIWFAAFAAESRGGPLTRSKPRLDNRKGEMLAVAAVATIVVAGASYWIGMRTAIGGDGPVAVFDQFTMPRPQPTVVPPVPVAASPGLSASHPGAPPEPAGSAAPPEPIQAPIAAEERKSTGAAPSKPSDGAATRTAPEAEADSRQGSAAKETKAPSDQMVRIGRYATQGDAEKGWATVLNRRPGMKSLRVVPVPIKSLRDGKTYYRMQIETTSRAQSEVVCKWVHDLDQNCTVLGSDEKSAEEPALSQ